MTELFFPDPSPEEITRMVARRLWQAQRAVELRHMLEDYPGEADEVAERLRNEAIGWASR